MKKVTKYFFQGLIVTLPAAATIYLMYWVLITFDNIFSFNIPGLGFLLILLIILAVGFIASNILTRRVTIFIYNLFNRLPLISIIYNSVKDLIEAFVGDKKKFNKPVLVKASKESSIEILGFITEENLELLGEKNKVAVYIPQAYNFAGNLIIVPSSDVKLVDAGAKEIMTFILSGGLSK
ncbi:MAG: DUF502 domain-containing protein [Ignavibacteria bacterium]